MAEIEISKRETQIRASKYTEKQQQLFEKTDVTIAKDLRF